jgi:hypothetical protein
LSKGGSSTVVQHLTHIPKIEGLIPADRKKNWEKSFNTLFCVIPLLLLLLWLDVKERQARWTNKCLFIFAHVSMENQLGIFENDFSVN